MNDLRLEPLLQSHTDMRINYHNKMLWYDAKIKSYIVYQLIIGNIYVGQNIEDAILKLVENK